jgi:hypothetical protein
MPMFKSPMTTNSAPERNQRLWVGLDQIASSATSFGCSALAAGLLPARDFGAWAVAFTVGILILTATRTWCGDALMILAPDGPSVSRRSTGSVSFALAVGLMSALALSLSAAFVEGSARAALAALAIGIPAVLMQDACRYGLLSRQRGRAAFANDALWMVLAGSSLLALRRADHNSVFLSMLAWSALAVPSVLLGLRQTGARPSVAAAKEWVGSVRHLSSRLFAEYLVFMASSLLALTVVVGVLGDVELAGSLRAAQVLMGPLTILLAATTTYLQPLMVIDYSRGESLIRRGCAQSGSVTLLSVLWIAALHLVPASVGTRIFGFTWFGARSELLEVGLVFFCASLSVGAINVLRCSGRVGRSLRVHAILACVVVGGTAVGAVVNGSAGAVAGFSVSSLAGPMLLWRAALAPDRSYHGTYGHSAVGRRGRRGVAPRSVEVEHLALETTR